MACSASPNIVTKKEKRSCMDIIQSANSILFGMSLADAASVAQEVKLLRIQKFLSYLGKVFGVV